MTAVLTADGSSGPRLHEQVAERLRSEQFFWLDIDGVDDEVKSMLGDTFGIHPLAFTSACEFHQRPKVEDYDDYTYMVAYGATDGGRGSEPRRGPFPLRRPLRGQHPPRQVRRPSTRCGTASPSITAPRSSPPRSCSCT